MEKNNEFFLDKNIDTQVNVLSSIPLYYQISEILKKMINKSNIPSGTPVPSEEKLAKYFKVSRPTINRAIAELVQSSILSKQKGKRAYVKGYFNLLFINELLSFGDILSSMNMSHSTKTLTAKKIKADKTLAKLLDLKLNENIYLIVRLRYIEDDPIIIVKSYLPEKYFPNMLSQNFEKRDLYEILASEYGVHVEKGEREVRAIKCLDEESRLLQMPIGDPVLYLKSVVTSNDSRKIEYFEAKLKGEKITLFTTVFSPQR